MKPTFEIIKKLLNEAPVYVQFKKLDGSIRNMKCTNNLDLIPEEFHPKHKDSTVTPNDKIVCVYDLENNGWRSFIGDNVITYSIALQ